MNYNKLKQQNYRQRILAQTELAIEAQCAELLRGGYPEGAAALAKVSERSARFVVDALLRHYTIRERRRKP